MGISQSADVNTWELLLLWLLLLTTHKLQLCDQGSSNSNASEEIAVVIDGENNGADNAASDGQQNEEGSLQSERVPLLFWMPLTDSIE